MGLSYKRQYVPFLPPSNMISYVLLSVWNISSFYHSVECSFTDTKLTLYFFFRHHWVHQIRKIVFA